MSRDLIQSTGRERRHRRSALILLAVVSLLGLAIGAAADESPMAPDFRLDNLDGDTVELRTLLAKGPVILDFWATWCGPCRTALPHLQTLHAELGKDGLQVVGISVDEPRTRAKIAATAKSLGLEFPILLDTDKRVAQRYQVSGIPATFLLTPDGRVAWSGTGYRDGDDKLLAERVRAILDAETTIQ